MQRPRTSSTAKPSAIGPARIIICLTVALAGCAAAPLQWIKAGATEAQFAQDRRECEFDVAKATQTYDPSMRSMLGQDLQRVMRQRELGIMCLRARGYEARQ